MTVEALEQARAGNGPTLIEAFTYRRNPHTTSDDDGRYREGAMTDDWATLDPIERLRTHLRDTGTGDDFFDDVAVQEAALSERLRAGCRALPNPEPASSFLHTYVEMPADLARQMNDHLEYVAAGEVDPA